MSCVMCELYTAQLRPAVDMLVVPYSARLSVTLAKNKECSPGNDCTIETCKNVLRVLM